MREHLLKEHPGLKPLVLLHTGRTKAPEAKAPAAQALLEEMRAAGQFYATPAGSNDDWCALARAAVWPLLRYYSLFQLIFRGFCSIE